MSIDKRYCTVRCIEQVVMPSLLEAADIHELITHRTIGQSCEDTAIDNITAVVVNEIEKPILSLDFPHELSQQVMKILLKGCL